ncbi:hypothetical protein VFPPC_12727 [Pochonia chlamydosporia 170]|uniref:DUF7703 domain-containing protein n=1 Tax=Pochonia chlamydosporia 170 TaxID=1380566 RepID=A0A179G497_METCM|nr:hypothetical protein VFPPC_12727 [Pochonia chlamydosporia 170]OAQ72191.1 hypothetical protein VFPPC_12727 [Pochonia chlamydosporia 170]
MSSSESGMSKDPAVPHPVAIAIACFLAISMYNVVELIFIIIVTFKKRNSLYFWSFMVATVGIAIHAIGFLLRDFQITKSRFLYVTFMSLGWYAMVTGQSVVLFSRLHLVLYNRNWLRAVRVLIITNAIVCHIPTTVMTYGASSSDPEPFLGIYSIYERVQVTIFFFQEVVISGLYVHEAMKFLQIRAIRGEKTNHNMMRHLISSNIFVIMLDVTILALEFSNLYDLQTSYKGAAYSMKLKLEFSVLNRLVKVVQPPRSTYCNHTNDLDGTIQLESVDSRNKIGRSIADKMQSGYEAHVKAGGARYFGDCPDLDVPKKSLLRTTEIFVTEHGKSIPWQRPTNGA